MKTVGLSTTEKQHPCCQPQHFSSQHCWAPLSLRKELLSSLLYCGAQTQFSPSLPAHTAAASIQVAFSHQHPSATSLGYDFTAIPIDRLRSHHKMLNYRPRATTCRNVILLCDSESDCKQLTAITQENPRKEYQPKPVNQKCYSTPSLSGPEEHISHCQTKKDAVSLQTARRGRGRSVKVPPHRSG